MAQLLIRQAHGGQSLTIDDSAWPYFEGQRYVIIDTLDDSSDGSPLYLSAAESDLRYVETAGIGDDTHPDGIELRTFFEAKVDRTSATTGQVPVLQADGTLLFDDPSTATVPDASETVAGKVELATAAETTTGTDDTRAVHPAGLKVELDKKAALLVTTTQQTGTTDTLGLADAETQIEYTNGSAVTVTVPPNSSVAFSIGTTIVIRQYGAGQVTVAPGVGVTLRAAGGALKTAAQYAALTLTKRGADEWFVDGYATT